MKKIYQLVVGAILSIALLTQCNDPLRDMEINVNTDVINYSTMIQIEDGNGNPVSNVTARLSGAYSDVIYNLAGKKDFTINGGLLGLGVHPKSEPTQSVPVEFSVELSGSGFLTQVVPISIQEQQFESVKVVNMLKIADAPSGVAVDQSNVGLVDNTTTTNQTIATNPENGTAQTVEITVTAGTQFQNAEGTAISGDQLRSSVVYLDPAKETALNVFPGGSLTSNNVVAEGSPQAVSGSFNPASVVNIEFTIGSTQVRKFNKPIQLAIQLDPTFKNESTGSVIKAGDQLGIYSYETGTAQWRFEKNVTIAMENGKPVANFETDHLTWFMVGNYVSSCTNAVTLNLDASWMEAGKTYPLKVEAVLAGKVVNSMQVSANTTNKSVRMNNLPLSSNGLTIRVTTIDGQVLTSGAGVSIPSNGCSASHVVSLSKPTGSTSKVTLQLYVRCPGNQTVINVLPTFYLYYRPAAPSSNTSGYQLLGIVKNGLLSTDLLTPGATEYDFKAVWGEKIKYAHKKSVKIDNSATVGTQPGDIIGEKAGATNLQMLTENCP